MIVCISGLSLSIPSDYEEIKRRLRMLGLSPTGNVSLDRSRLQTAIKQKVEKLEEQKKEIKEMEEDSELRQLEEEKKGAEAIAQQNKFFFGL